MSDDQEVTLGEVYRLCLSIDETVKKQNGRVRKLEDDAIRIKTIGAIGVFSVPLLYDYIKTRWFGA